MGPVKAQSIVRKTHLAQKKIWQRTSQNWISLSMNLLYYSSGQTQIPFGISSNMWTPLGLFLYISISSLTVSSTYNLQNNGIEVLKSLHVSSAQECNQTCNSVADQDGLECNWVVIEEKQNLCFYLHCLDIPVCKRVTVEDAKALQIGQGLPNKIFLSRIQRDRTIDKKISRKNSTILKKSSPVLSHRAIRAIATRNASKGTTTVSPTTPSTITTTTTVSSTLSTTTTAMITVSSALPTTTTVSSVLPTATSATTTASSPLPTKTTATTTASSLLPTTTTATTTTSTTLPTTTTAMTTVSSALPNTTIASSTLPTTTTATTTLSSALPTTTTATTTLSPALPTTTAATTTIFQEVTSTTSAIPSVSISGFQTPPTMTIIPTPNNSTINVNESTSSANEHTTQLSTTNLAETTELLTSTAQRTASTSTTVRQTTLAKALSTKATNISNASVTYTQTTTNKMNSSAPVTMTTSTMARGASKSPEKESRTTPAFNDGNYYIFPSVPAGSLIKHLADTSSLIAILIFGLLFFLVSIILFAQKAFESNKRKDYVQVDYLINGMYADSDM
ncbi:cell wall protein DAN4-like isoform X2 [Rhincodon typus]|uniref:cell wall protein DAN4-like isoform X2 n=1 Tax=Rhincodon typus TaxID=259920 RepID=UPI00203025E8|nr:cell wall protein DAN4-like isoform X2 [Rhincodon typus]